MAWLFRGRSPLLRDRRTRPSADMSGLRRVTAAADCRLWWSQWCWGSWCGGRVWSRVRQKDDEKSSPAVASSSPGPATPGKAIGRQGVFTWGVADIMDVLARFCAGGFRPHPRCSARLEIDFCIFAPISESKHSIPKHSQPKSRKLLSHNGMLLLRAVFIAPKLTVLFLM